MDDSNELQQDGILIKHAEWGQRVVKNVFEPDGVPSTILVSLGSRPFASCRVFIARGPGSAAEARNNSGMCAIRPGRNRCDKIACESSSFFTSQGHHG